MVDQARPPSRSGRKTRSNPAPASPARELQPAEEAGEHNTPLPNHATSISPQSDRVTRSQNGSVVDQGPDEPESNWFQRANALPVLAGRKRRRTNTDATSGPQGGSLKQKDAKKHKALVVGGHNRGLNRGQTRQPVKLPSKDAGRGGHIPSRSTAPEDGHERRDTAPKAHPQVAPSSANGQRSDDGQDKRTLRSHDGGSRLKSDLATYFSNYDDIINGVTQNSDLLPFDLPIYLVDKPKVGTDTNQNLPLRQKLNAKTPGHGVDRKHVRNISINGSTVQLERPQLNGAQTVDIAGLLKGATHPPSASSKPDHDPLPDSYYLKAHSRAERREKQLRNIEKERAQHEKTQLELLLEALQGPDWLKVMGVTGITDGDKKDFEPKRDYFVKEVKLLVRKFHDYRAEEKRLKEERDKRKAAEEEEEEEFEDDDDTEVEHGTNSEPSSRDDHASIGPDSSDLDAWASEQLRNEALSSSEPQTRGPTVGRPPQTPTSHRHKTPKAPKEDPEEHMMQPLPSNKPFTSFYAAPHLRTQALGKSRQGRSNLAFGQPIPELFDDMDYELPLELKTAERLRVHARKRRMAKREQSQTEMEVKREMSEKGRAQA